MSIIDKIENFELVSHSKNGETIKMLRSSLADGVYRVTIPFDSGYDYTTISGSKEDCMQLIQLLQRMVVES